MGIRGISIGSVLIVLLIVLLIFGTKRLRTIGDDMGSALKGFFRAFKEEDEEKEKAPEVKKDSE